VNLWLMKSAYGGYWKPGVVADGKSAVDVVDIGGNFDSVVIGLICPHQCSWTPHFLSSSTLVHW
jgi:hypothetical protein